MHDDADTKLSVDYADAIGTVMDARRHYDKACTAQGPESWAAEQAQAYLERATLHRDDMRERYNAEGGGAS